MSDEERVAVSVGASGAVVHLSKAECWELFVLLEDDAPFVRNQLAVIRHGGAGGVALTTAAERRQVFYRLASHPGNGGALDGGLRLLKAALAASRADRGADDVVRSPE